MFFCETDTMLSATSIENPKHNRDIYDTSEFIYLFTYPFISILFIYFISFIILFIY